MARLACFGALFTIAAALSSAEAHRLVRIAGAWVSILSAYGLVAWATGVNPLLGAAEVYPRQLESTFINPNAFAIYAGFGAMAILATMLDRRMFRPRRLARDGWVWLAAFVVAGAAIAATGSRGGVASVLLGLSVFALVYWGWRGLFTFVLAAPAAAAVGLTLTVDKAKDATIPFEADRWAVHRDVIAAIGDAPYTGYGFGAFQDAFRPHVTEWRWGDWDHAHQMYLETAFELGVPAAIALMLSIALVGLRIAARARGRPMQALALGALSAAAAHSLVDFSLAVPAVAAALAVFLGLGYRDARR